MCGMEQVFCVLNLIEGNDCIAATRLTGSVVLRVPVGAAGHFLPQAAWSLPLPLLPENSCLW